MKKQVWWRSIRMLWFYPIVAIILMICIFVFSALYSGGGAHILQKTAEQSTYPDETLENQVPES